MLILPLQRVDSVQMRVETRQKMTRRLWINQSVTLREGRRSYVLGREQRRKYGLKE